MSLVSIKFHTLFPGELPGDPELGGWRPISKRFYTSQVQLMLSLEELVRLTAFKLHEFQLRQAIGIVVHNLAS